MKNKVVFLGVAVLIIAGVFVFTMRRGEDVEREVKVDDVKSEPSIRDSGTIEPPAEIVAAMERLNVPIEFWGQVVDQDGQAVEGAAVTASVRKGVATSVAEKVDHLETVSGPTGRFSFGGIRGFRLSLENIEKEGYRLASRQVVNMNYDGGHVAANSADEPYQYVLIRLEEEPSLFFGEYNAFTNWEGDPMHLDLRKGIVDEPSDLEIVAVRQQGRSNRYDWELSVSSVDGGGIAKASPEAAPTVAPVGGYQSEWSIGYLHDADDYRGGGDWDFFVRTKEGNYARVQITAYLSEKRRNSNLAIRVFVNESGGRVLEGDDTNSRY